MDRRSYLVTAGSTVSVLLAGCLSSDTTDDSSGSDSADSGNTDDGDDPNPNEADDGNSSDANEETNGDPDSEPIDAVEAYIQAGKEASVESAIEAVHEDSPLMVVLEEGETNFDDEIEDVEIVSYETIDRDVTAPDVLDLRYAETVFQDEDDLVSTLNEENAVLLEISFSPADALREDTWVVVTEGNEWKVFWATDEPPADPEEQFEPEIIDEDENVVADIDWDPDVDSPGTWAQVTLTEEPGIEADLVRIESTVGGSEFRFSGESEEAWAGSWANVNLNSSGDQIVVTAITEDEETVIHRVHYDP